MHPALLSMFLAALHLNLLKQKWTALFMNDWALV